MKNVLGLDLGTTSIGWALVKEAENSDEKSSIVRIGVRVNPLTVDEQTNFAKGKPITTNAERRLKRGARRNLQRYKLRRNHLINELRDAGIVNNDTIFAETGPRTTFETLRLRAKAAEGEISLEEFARVLIMINKKRGYKSNRKAKAQDEGEIIDGMDVAKLLYDNDYTPGQLCYIQLCNGKSTPTDFYKSDLQAEFEKIWNIQSKFYPDIMTNDFKESLTGKNEKQTWAICQSYFNIEGIKRPYKGKELIKDNYRLRSEALIQQLEPEYLVIALQKVNQQIASSNGYLGNISDRSKELYFSKQTIGQYFWEKIKKDSHFSMRNRVFYRQDYLDEFEKLWSVQQKYHPELTDNLKKNIRDIVIFYQRPLKSQKGLVSICEFENKEVTIESDGKTKRKIIGPKVCPKSSPLFQEFKIRQILNNLTVNKRYLSAEEKETLFDRVRTCEKLSKKEIIKCLSPLIYTSQAQDTLFASDDIYKRSELTNTNNELQNVQLNYREIDGDCTSAAFLKVYSDIIARSGHNEYDFSKMAYSQAVDVISDIFKGLGYKTDFLNFNSNLDGKEFEQQPYYHLWHLLYSYEGDKSVSGNEKLIEKIANITGFEREYSKLLANITFKNDYGNLSTKAIKKILPYLKEGNRYDVACAYAGYNHSKTSLTKEQVASKQLKDRLDNIPKNTLRNPVVEKILNQMINVVNTIVDQYGRPDEIRIELARELKKSAKEREQMTSAIIESDKIHKEICTILNNEFGILNPSRNDIIRYKLYEELKDNGYHSLYSNTYIPREKIFSKEFDIEHIIPQARLFDDSFSNKTLESRQINIEKSNRTAYDFVKEKYGGSSIADYEARVEKLFKENAISKAKRNKLLMSQSEIPSDFIARDLRDSQYIAKKAKSILEDISRYVVSTTGAITDRLRNDWQLVDIMKELALEKYDKLGLTEMVQGKDGKLSKQIKNKEWSKRCDHRHHAMDALTIAFTKISFIQYLNNLNARIPKEAGNEDYLDLSEYNLQDIPKEERSQVVSAIESSQLYRDSKGKLRFLPPMPLNEFRSEAKRHLENTLVSIKAKNKVVTKNTNHTKCAAGANSRVQLTPRGELHLATVYGMIKRYSTKEEKVGATFNLEKIKQVASPVYRTALEKRLTQFGGDAKKAFSGKNSLDKSPIYLDGMHTVAVPDKVTLVSFTNAYTIRKDVSPDLKLDKVADGGIKRILQARLTEFDNDAKKAFSDLDNNPIWLNKEKGIQIKRVKIIEGVNHVIPIHDKHDNFGKIINCNDSRIPTDYVKPGSNHHIAIFIDEAGNMHERVVTFYDAVIAANTGDPIVDRNYKKEDGWKFLFTMKQNEYFVFPNKNTGFDPNEYDLTNPDNYALISPNLFRVQKLSSKYYVFRHHLETDVEEKPELRDIAWKRISSIEGVSGIVKVRINHIGQIVHVGEY